MLATKGFLNAYGCKCGTECLKSSRRGRKADKRIFLESYLNESSRASEPTLAPACRLTRQERIGQERRAIHFIHFVHHEWHSNLNLATLCGYCPTMSQLVLRRGQRANPLAAGGYASLVTGRLGSSVLVQQLGKLYSSATFLGP